MKNVGEQRVSLVEAARTLFNTRAPDARQVDRVYRLMRAGQLAVCDPSAAPSKWTTTEQALAEFMAERRMRAYDAQSAAGSPPEPPNPAQAHRYPAVPDAAQPLRAVYHGIWREYFLAVMLRRRVSHRSKAFQHAVLAGQVGVLAVLVSLILFTILHLTGRTMPPERQAVQTWLAGQTDDFHITRWHPSVPDAAPETLLVRVEYRYQLGSPRWIHTDRTFRVAPGEVTELGPDESL